MESAVKSQLLYGNPIGPSRQEIFSRGLKPGSFYGNVMEPLKLDIAWGPQNKACSCGQLALSHNAPLPYLSTIFFKVPLILPSSVS